MSVIDGTSGNDRITPTFISGGVTGTPSAFPDDGFDELHGHAGNDFLAAGGGRDAIYGDDFTSESGNDTLDGGAGADTLYGANGNDVYIVDDNGDEIYEAVGGTAGGVDRVQSASINLDLNHYDNAAGLENASLLGTSNLNIIGSGRSNVLTGNGGANGLWGGAGNDTVLGGVGNDTLLGGGGNDSLDGQPGVDYVSGDAGNDTLFGGPGGDVLVGGAGRDVFSFGKLIGSVPGAMDQIFGEDAVSLALGAPAFEGAANTTAAGQQGFVFGGTGKGHISLVDSGMDTIVRANMDNDAAFEFQLVIHDGNVHANAYTAADFILDVV
jgi:Ca2+-binding RTX toxin-like protein